MTLPKFPASSGPVMATRLDRQRGQYRAKADALRDTLAKLDEVWAEAFAEDDKRQTARDRVAELAQKRTR
ncbi:hypothetical protein ASE14_18375 [Agromyces sp. Root81]|uniref:hypothetical protein n=1 Tax=Agromyces sp. Root81 TaxID=1736601 RepID=UPI0006F5DF53|nr:hypothetical protein [Agromyces sp. Root81]KRC58543.1 hypothetical protein ASE14_18375 [Agromyces sp. Root81]